MRAFEVACGVLEIPNMDRREPMSGSRTLHITRQAR